MKQQTSYLLVMTTVVASLGGFLFGFDMAVVSGILPFVKQQFALSAFQEGWFVSSALAGCIVGVIISGNLSDRLGRKKLLYMAALLFLLAALGCAFLSDLSWIIAARILGGVAVGIASSIVPLYLSEIAPDDKRGRLVTYYQLAVTIGILVAYCSNAQLLSYAEAHKQDKGEGLLHFLFVLVHCLLHYFSQDWLGCLKVRGGCYNGDGQMKKKGTVLYSLLPCAGHY
jgi:SP family arabinose:H+ symporter-like MFS transporter